MKKLSTTAAEIHIGAHKFGMEYGRRAEYRLTLFLYGARNSGLGAGHGMIGNRYVTRYADLTCKSAAFADFGAACNAHHSAANRILSYLNIVGYLAKVVDFNTLMNKGRTHLRLVYTGICPYFHIILDYHIACVLDFLVGAVRRRCKAETIGTNDNTCVQYYIITYHHTGIYGHIRIDYAVVADSDVVANGDVLIYFGEIADASFATDIREIAEIDLFAELCSSTDAAMAASISARSPLACSHIVQEFGDSAIGIFDLDESGRNGL